ncbi:MAG: SsrA-binding protein SmpB [Deltaproteobacteria bacterium]|nr:SsrA-binding protein SmpB [Deltaproteobacteria bacterium]
MAAKKKGKKDKSAEPGGVKTIASNRKARFLYEILDEMEAGIALTGAEVKSLRAGNASMGDAYCQIERGEIFMHHCHIGPYEQARDNLKPTRKRKLLMHAREIRKLHDQVKSKGITIVPLSIYFNERGRCKVEIAVCRGKKLHDKRDSIKERDSKRDLDRMRKKARR